MSRIKVPAEGSSEFVKSEGVSEICDENGKTLGYFIPTTCGLGKPPADLEIPYSTEEVEALRQHRSGRTLEEILLALGLQ